MKTKHQKQLEALNAAKNNLDYWTRKANGEGNGLVVYSNKDNKKYDSGEHMLTLFIRKIAHHKNQIAVLTAKLHY